MRVRLGVQYQPVLDHQPVRPLRHPGRALLRRQYLQQWLLLQRQLHGRRRDMQHWEYVRLKLQLRHLQVRTLHLRKFRRAVLPYKHLRDRHRLRNERSGLYFKHQQPHIDVPAVWKERRSVLRKLHLHRRRHAVPQQQLFIHVFVQGVRRHWPGLLLKLHIHRPCVQGSRNGLRHHQQCLHGLWLRRRPLLRQQYLQRCKHGVQELSLCRVRHAGLDLFNRRSLLRGQHLQERMLCHALRWFVLRLSNLSLGRHGLRHPCQQHDRSSLRLDHCGNRHLHERHHFLRWPQPSLLRFQLLLRLYELRLLCRPRHPLFVQHFPHHRPYAVLVHRLRRQGPALLRGFNKFDHRLRARLQVTVRVRPNLYNLRLLLHLHGFHGNGHLDVDHDGLLEHRTAQLELPD